MRVHSSAIIILTLVLPAARGDTPADVLDMAPSHFATSGDAKVHYKSLGSGDTALVFVHGWCCDHTVWRDQAAAFNGKLRMLFIDLPGYGKSEKPKAEYTMERFAKGVDSVLQDAGVEHAVLAGHSMGTPVVVEFYRLFPKKTKGLVFVDGALRPFFTDPKQAEGFLSIFKEETFKQSAPQFLAGMFRKDTSDAVRKHIADLVAAADPRVAVSSMRNMITMKSSDEPIKVPAQALMAKSPLWTDDYKAFAKKMVPDLDYREFDGVSHFLFMEQPKEVNAALAEFLKKQGMMK
jgi:pimeloyl-ACP methyl ester carboxylesterase